MTTLRVLVSAPPSPGRAEAWALFNADGSVARTGRDRPDALPAADIVEIVIGASQVRIASVALPPLPPGRVAAAAAFALEDEFAGPAEAQHLAVSSQESSGRVRVVIVARALMAALRARGTAGAMSAATRIVAEPELAMPQKGWRWCAGESGGFLRLPDGSAIAMESGVANALPSELEFALARARREGAAPTEVRVEAHVESSLLPQWEARVELPFVRGTPWRWHAATPASFAAATNLLQGEFAPVQELARGDRLRLFAPALWILAIALTVHVLATAGEWTWLKFDAARTTRAWGDVAEAAGLPAQETTTPAAAREALARRISVLRHAQGIEAPGDALPLFARAAPALAALPPATLKSAAYADGHWTLDLASLDAATMAALDARLRGDGVSAVSAVTPAGARMRIGAP